MSNEMDKIFLNEILREYDLIKIRNNKKANIRKRNLYARYPELDELEKKMNETELNIAKLVLKKIDLDKIVAKKMRVAELIFYVRQKYFFKYIKKKPLI